MQIFYVYPAIEALLMSTKYTIQNETQCFPVQLSQQERQVISVISKLTSIGQIDVLLPTIVMWLPSVSMEHSINIASQMTEDVNEPSTNFISMV
jgi:hypothetical protein